MFEPENIKKRKKVVLYCDHWQNGGVEAYLMNQLRHWDLSKMECSILTAEKTTEIYDKELQKLKVPHFVLLEGESPSPILRILKTFRAFKRFLKEHSCDILYLNLTNSVTMRYAKVAKRLGIPRRIIHSHSSGIQPGAAYGIKITAHKAAKRYYANVATDWWACSDVAADFLFLSQKKDKIVFIPNAIETERFCFGESKRAQLRQQLFGHDNIKVIGTVGRCSAEKNQAFLLKVFARAYVHMPDARLLLIGDGALRLSLEEQARTLRISDVCLFYGFTEDVAPLYSAMDVFCLPSVVEGFGIVALEAQAAGCQCLLSDVVPKQTKVLETTQYLPLDIQVWVQRLMNALQQSCDKDVRQGAAGQVKSMGFDIADCAKKTQRLLLETADDGDSIS